jgi:hypothetical protein
MKKLIVIVALAALCGTAYAEDFKSQSARLKQRQKPCLLNTLMR